MKRLKSHNKVAGIKQTKSAINSDSALVVYVATDVDFGAVAEILTLCSEKGIELINNCSRKELAKACGIDVPCSAAAIIK